MHTYDGYVAPTDRDILLTFEDLCERWNYKYQSLNAKLNRGFKIPPHVTLPCGAKRWRREDVLYFEEREHDAQVFVRQIRSFNDGAKAKKKKKKKAAA